LLIVTTILRRGSVNVDDRLTREFLGDTTRVRSMMIGLLAELP
jgi:hypothetical protein